MVRIIAIIFVSFIISMANLGPPVAGQVAFEEDEAETISPGAVDKEELAELKDHPPFSKVTNFIIRSPF